MLILISDAFDPSLPARLARFGEVSEDSSRLAEADILLVRSTTKCTRDYLDRATKLQLIIRGGIGLDNIDLGYAEERGILVENTPEASSIAVAELTMTLMLAAVNRLTVAHEGLQRGQWLKKELGRTELCGKILGLIGVGRIGNVVARRSAAFGMRVIGYDPYVERSEAAELESLDDVLSLADILSLHAPATTETNRILNEERLAKTKRGVVIVNTGRGKCVDEAAVARRLESGHIRSYATDVWLSDPPAPDCLLLRAPNVLMTPHIGSSTRENLLRIGDQIVQTIERFLARLAEPRNTPA